MATFIDFVTDTWSNTKRSWFESKTLVSMSVIGVGASMWYVVKRGPYQAWKIGTLYLGQRPTAWSVRKQDMQTIKDKMSCLNPGKYLVVTGGNGVGKSCMLDSIFYQRPGVLTFSISPTLKQQDIVGQVFASVCGSELKSFEQEEKSMQVLKWYNTFYPQFPITIILKAQQRSRSDPHTNIPHAAEHLSKFGFQVLVDAQEHSISSFRREQATYVNIKPMAKGDIFSIQELKYLYWKLGQWELDEEAWHIIGGNPNRMHFLSLNSDTEEMAVDFLFGEIFRAKLSVENDCLQNPQLNDMFSIFRKRSALSYFDQKSISHETHIDSVQFIDNYFTPANQTIAFVLRLGELVELRTNGLSLQENKDKLKKMVSYYRQQLNVTKEQKK
jgi:hypothetical protein